MLCLGSVTPAMAATLSDCRSLTDSGGRLACYDSLPDVREPAVAGATAGAHVPEQPDAPGISATSEVTGSNLGQAWELDAGQRGHLLRIRPYKPVYLLPFFRTSNRNTRPSSPAANHSVSAPVDLDDTEAKLQISLKTKIAEDIFGDNGDLWFGYTQTSRWQVYNDGLSRPFRETNHEPELMLGWRTEYDFLGWRGRLSSLSLNHQSNGRSLPLSRSWNRLMVSTSLERGDWTMTVRPWWRIPEHSSDDDNPDISNYLGRADLQLVRNAGGHQFSVLLRHNLRLTNSRGAVQLDYAFPIAGELRGHLQWFSGYGESMIDYNHRANYIGVGVSLVEW